MITIKIHHFLQRTPRFGELFNQHIEPQGFYFTPLASDASLPVITSPGAISGFLTLKNPLIITLKPNEQVIAWKKHLFVTYNRKGICLSRHLFYKLNYDSILVRYDDDESFLEGVYFSHLFNH